MTKEQLEAKLIKAEKKAQKIKEQLKELEQPELKNGWYSNGSSCLTYYDFYTGTRYGFNYNSWCDGDDANDYFSKGFDKPATQEEVEAALIAEAKKRGFKDEITDMGGFIGVDGLKKHGKSYMSGGYWSFSDNTLRCCGVPIFKDGKWAKIIEEPKVKINGYEMEQEDGIISFGCAKFFTNELKTLNQRLSSFNNTFAEQNRKIKSITLDSGVEITIQELKQIVDNIK